MRSIAGRATLVACVLVATLMTTLAMTATAGASPPTDVISEANLQALLETGPVTGYFETILGGATLASQDPVQIPVTVQSIVPMGGETGDLILFQASGADIDAVGGIAAGMSGSPLYVNDGSSTPKLAGAVSYGESFTTHDLGLATPIGDMTAIEQNYFSGLHAAAPITLRTPLVTPAGDVGKIVLAPSATAARAMKVPAGTRVMAPLSELQVNGLIATSPVYKRLVAKLATKGFDVSPSSAGSYRGGLQVSGLTGGSALGVMYSTGDFAMGGLGTVTYVDPDNGVVLAFGHPLDYIGPTSLDLTSAWVQGTWSSGIQPHKVMSPVATIGAITQDRGAGVAGVLGDAPVQVPVTSQATLDGVTKSSETAIAQTIADDPDWADLLPSSAAAVAMQRAADAGSLRGSATSTVDITVTDGVTDYHVQRTDLWSDTSDVMSFATDDIDNAMEALTIGTPGVTAKVKAIDFSTVLSATDREAQIEDVTAPSGLRVGTNHLTVTLLTPDGSEVAVPVSLVIPAGTSPKGTLEVFSATTGPMPSGLPPGLPFFSTSSRGAGLKAGAPASLASLVAEINGWPKNTELDVFFTPENEGAVVKPVETLVDTHDWFISGEAQKNAGEIQVFAPGLLAFGEPVPLFGVIGQADETTTVRVYERPAGQASDRLVATLPATLANDGSASFDTLLGGLTKNTVVTCVWDGDADNLAARAATRVTVKARLSLAASATRVAGQPLVRLTARVTPAQTDGAIFIDRLVGTRWVHVLRLPAKTPVGQWRAPVGTYRLRAVLVGSSSNAGTTSSAVTVKVR
jgi:hypothetical protein